MLDRERGGLAKEADLRVDARKRQSEHVEVAKVVPAYPAPSERRTDDVGDFRDLSPVARKVRGTFQGDDDFIGVVINSKHDGTIFNHKGNRSPTGRPVSAAHDPAHNPAVNFLIVELEQCAVGHAAP